ncbi:MAG: hypothetical protein ACRC1P_09370, partial [Cellulosilyticaceae bacterium]
VQEQLVMIPYYLADIEKIAKVEVDVKVIETRPIIGEIKKIAIKGMMSCVISYIDTHKERQEVQNKSLFVQELEVARKSEAQPSVELQLEKYHYGMINPREMMIWAKMNISEG